MMASHKARRRPGQEDSVSRVEVLGHPLTLVAGRFTRKRFVRHAHDTYLIGVSERGGCASFYRGGQIVAPVGSICMLNPGEIHSGHAAEGRTWDYRGCYPNAEILSGLAGDLLTGAPDGDRPLFFREPVVHCPRVARRYLDAHLAAMRGVELLAVQSGLIDVLAEIIQLYAQPSVMPMRIRDDGGAVRLGREYIEAYYGERLSLSGIASVAGLSPYHFLRVFEQGVGMTPYAYVLDIRIRRATQLLESGSPISRTAFETGFADQSHLTRQFKRHMGVTPGQYRRLA